MTKPDCVPFSFEQADRGSKRLQFLLKQAEVFQHFAPISAAAETKKCGPSASLHAFGSVHVS